MSRDRSLRGHAEVGTGTQRGAPDRQIGSKVNAVASGYLTRLSEGKKTREKARKKRKKEKKRQLMNHFRAIIISLIISQFVFVFYSSRLSVFFSVPLKPWARFFSSLSTSSFHCHVFRFLRRRRERDEKKMKNEKKGGFRFSLSFVSGNTLFSLLN